MEPEGGPLTPGTSYGPQTSYVEDDSTGLTGLNHIVQAPGSPNKSEEQVSGQGQWARAGDEGFEQTGGPLLGSDPRRGAQRRFRPSAFPSSLTWDSDSEKETIDEEELRHFSNPHGLAAHSPGSPSSGLRLDSEDDPAPSDLSRLQGENDRCIPAGRQQSEPQSTNTRQPDRSEPGRAEQADSVRDAHESAKLFLSSVIPADGLPAGGKERGQEAIGEGRRREMDKDPTDPDTDVYTFPGDSDPESPPPAPWAQCTFIQRRRRKRALLRPFSGLASWTGATPGGGKREREGSEPPQVGESAQLGGGGGGGAGAYDSEEGPGAHDAITAGGGDADGGGESEGGKSKHIFTCVECSIYFRKQMHLHDHMAEHCQRDRLAKGGRFRCVECGWNLANALALADHCGKHQESREKILEEIEKLDDSGKGEETQKDDPLSPGIAVVQGQCIPTPIRVSDPDKVATPTSSPPPVSALDDSAQAPVLDATVTAVPTSLRTPARTRAAPSSRRRFVCPTCNFSTRTSQAMSNHAKTHNRKKSAPQRASSVLQPTFPVVEAGRSPSSLACGHCAFLAPSQAVLQEHHSLAHPGKASICGAQSVGMGQHIKVSVDTSMSNISAAREQLSRSEYEALSSDLEGKGKQGATVGEDSSLEHRVTSAAASRTSRDLAFKCIGNRRANRQGRGWTEAIQPRSSLDGAKLPDSEDEQREGQSAELNTELGQSLSASPVRLKPHTRARASLGDSSVTHQSGASPVSAEKTVKEEEEQETKQDQKVFCLRRSSRVIAASVENNTDDEDDEDDDGGNEEVDEEQMRRFLSEGIYDEDEDEIDEETGALRRVERKCPYCSDRFYNGIGLANHVRGHLNRVGVSYNVRHFISAEEVNAIERKFSYQKKKKKVANFDPDTFSVMRCEFCSAGFDTRAGLSSHARAHLRDFGITNWDVTISPIHILRELFSSRPDLVIPTAPPRSPGYPPEEGEDDEEDDDDDDEKGIAEEVEEIKEEDIVGETVERAEGDTVSNPLLLGSPTPWTGEGGAEEPEVGGLGEEQGEDEELRDPALHSLSSSPVRKEEDADGKVGDLKCEACGAQFETRRGLSSHARSHLRQLGVGVSESSGAPIDLLYKITKDHRGVDGHFSAPAKKLSARVRSVTPDDVEDERDLDNMDFEEKPIPLSVLARAVRAAPPSTPPAPPPASSPSSVVRKAPISSLLPASSPLRSPDHKGGGMKSVSASLSALPAAVATSKPLWAPQDSDAPLNLTLDADPNKDIICQLCGAWFETRKGLSSHARAHLRHFGVEYSESKGSPIDLLNQLIHTDDFKHKAGALQPDGLAGAPKRRLLAPSSSSPSSTLLFKVGAGSPSKATSSSLLGPPAKRPKSSSLQVFRLSSGELMAVPHSEPAKEIGCEFCGEYFENRKGLSSHARSHLRQMGITEWSVNGSPIDTLREIIARRGLPCALPLKPLKTPPPSSPGPPRSPMSSSSSPSSASLLGRLPFTFTRPSSPQPAAATTSSSSSSSSGGLILKMKPEPLQLDVTSHGAAGLSGGFPSEPLNCSWNTADSVFPLNLAMAHEAEPTRDIRCEFCGEYFENRKGLSSHARSHLRQLGITEWSVNGSPIDTLKELMHQRGTSSPSDPGVKRESGLGASSPKWESAGRPGSSDNLTLLGYQSPKFRKSPLSLLHSGSRLHKHGLVEALSPTVASSAGKFFRVSQLGKRPLSEETVSREMARSPPQQLKSFSPLQHDFPFKRKSSPEKHGGGHQDASCELCGFYFENRKALASHARAHLRQFGVTEWCVNGSPIETLSAWMRSRPQKVVEMHRSYMQGNRFTLKKKSSSPLSPSSDPEHILPASSQKACYSSSSSSSSSSTSQWSSMALSLVRPMSREMSRGSKGTNLAGPLKPNPSHEPGSFALPQVARSELNVRLPRGFERRPLKHPSCPDGGERESGPPKPPRTGTIPSLVPKPPSYPLVKLVGKLYTLKCRFCEVEFHGPLSVQEEWIRHLQQHILKMNYKKSAVPRDTSSAPPAPRAQDPAPQTQDPAPRAQDPAPRAQDPVPGPAPVSTSSTTPTPAVRTSTPSPGPPSSLSPTPVAETPPAAGTQIGQVSEEQATPAPTPSSVASPTPAL